MFGFDMMGSYESRKVARLDGPNGVMVGTALVTDGEHPYETAVAHPEYKCGEIIIVAAYDSKTDAQDGHDKWVGIMTGDPLPEHIAEIENSEISQLAGVGGELHPRVRP